MTEIITPKKSEEQNWDEIVKKSNERSWYLNKDEERPFITMSVGSVGPSREKNLARFAMAGNMSVAFGSPDKTKDDWYDEAFQNERKFLDSLNIPADKVYVLGPQRDYSKPLNMIEVDGTATTVRGLNRISEEADFIYTYNLETVLGVTPADCPIIITRGITPKGPILCYTHIAWRGAEAGYADQMFERFKELNMDFESLRLYVNCGARAESYTYSSNENPLDKNPDKNLLFKDVRQNENGTYDFRIDTPTYVRSRLIANGLNEYQIFQDTTDTARQDSGYHSHGRAMRNGKSGINETNGRDLLIASMTDYSNLRA